MKHKLLLLVLQSISFSIYAQVNLNQGLMAYYPFSSNANDASGNGNDGTTKNGVQLTTDRFGNANSAYFFDGIDDFIEIPNSTSLNPSNAFSIALYFNAEQHGTQTLIGKIAYSQGVGTQFQLAIDYNPFPGVLFGVNPSNNGCAGVGTNASYTNTGNSLSLNQWYCIVATFDNGVQKIYLDGNLIQTKNTGFTSLNQCTNANVQIGSWWSNDLQRFKGKIDDIRLYNRALNQQEIVSLCPLQTSLASFTAPDTVCVNTPVSITNTTTGAASYYWSFCSGNLSLAPQGANMGNIGGNFTAPVFMDYIEVNNNYYGFVTNYNNGNLIRLDFGNSLLNAPTSQNLGNFGGILPPGVGSEGIQLVQNEGKYYAIIVAGYTPAGSTPRVVKIEFGTNITNPTPAAVNWGNIGNLYQPIDLSLFKDNGNWYGFTANAENNTITRFNFTNSFDNIPTADNFSNIGDLLYPTGIYAINDNGDWKVFVVNGGSRTITTGPYSLTRLNFGSSLLNTPTGANLGSLGNTLQHPRDLTIIKSCGQITGFVVNGHSSYNDIVRLDFTNGLSAPPDAISLGNIGGLSFPHSISKLFRVDNDVYSFITNVNNNTMTRIRFAGCNNASVPNSTLQNPLPVTYNIPGTYNINLTTDDGLPTQSAYCKQVVVLPAHIPTVYNKTICVSDSIKIGASFKATTYLWSNGAITDSIWAKANSNYWVRADYYGCTATDTFNIAASKSAFDFSYKQDICNPLKVQFFNATTPGNEYWNMGDGTVLTNTTSPVHTFSAYGTYSIRFTIPQSVCHDTLTKQIAVTVVKDNILLTPDTTICYGVTKQLKSVSVLNACWSPVTYLDNPASANPITSTPQNITYYYTAEVTGANIIVNGDFSAGNTGFTSDYIQAGINTTEGEYTVGANPAAWNGGLSACKDHTSASGNMLLVNGSPAPNLKVWTQQIKVTPNTNYAFSTWIQALYTPNPAQLQFSINGFGLGNGITASLPTCTWTQFYTTWNSGNDTTAIISIINKNTQIQGNDFALDDISFAPVFIKTDSVKIIVDTPVVNTLPDTAICNGSTVQLQTTGAQTYSWSPAAGLSNASIANPVASPAQTVKYFVTGTNSHGCVATDSIAITVYPKPTILLSNDSLICQHTTAQLQASGGITYSWLPAATLNDPAIANPIAQPDTTTMYIVQVKDANQCSNTDSVQIAVKIPAFTITPDLAACEKDTVSITATGGDVYSWTPVTGLNDPDASTTLAAPAVTTQYAVQITDHYCQTGTTLKVLVTVHPLPLVRARKSNDVDCAVRTAQLTANGAVQYNWTPVTGLDKPGIYNPHASTDYGLAGTTTFIVTGTNQFGCSALDSVQVLVSKTNMPVYELPNAFTPNNDGLNDCFGIRKWGNVQIHEFSIYNRWGQRVFTTKNPSDCWDGRFKGTMQDSGGYVYVIKATAFCGEIERKGSLLLIR